MDFPTLKEFSTPWLGLVQHHESAKRLWKEQIGSAMKGFSNIRWFSREEVCNELAENFACLSGYIDTLLEDEIGDALPKKMHEILSKQGKELQAELACNLDMKPLLTTCYTLEGDGLTILLAYRKLSTILSWGETLGERAETMPNLAALLRARVDLKQPGAKIYEYFADVTPPR